MESAELEGCCCSIRINPREREGRGVRDILSRKGEDFFGLGNFGYCQGRFTELPISLLLLPTYLPTTSLLIPIFITVSMSISMELGSITIIFCLYN